MNYLTTCCPHGPRVRFCLLAALIILACGAANMRAAETRVANARTAESGAAESDVTTHAVDANRFCYLDDAVDPYYVDESFPQLTSAQWTGDSSVKAVVVLAIDDMRDPAKYEAFLRPILDRLKAHQGRASLSIMTNSVDPTDPQLATWINEGVSIEVHTIDHPCPLLFDGDLPKARSTYERCVDQMHTIPGNDPVAFRMPCCDSMNSPSPRFYESIFSQRTPEGNFLTIDSSVFNVTTADDPQLANDDTIDDDGRAKFQKYLPFKSFVNTIRNYPYPYLIGGHCWQFPCAVPSDWEAQNLHQPNNPQTAEDLKTLLDITVRKQGVMNLVFHPHGWIRNDQIVQLIDHAASVHGDSVRFMSFRDAQQRLDESLLHDVPVRGDDGTLNGIRICDINRDGFQDVVRLDSAGTLTTRLWIPKSQRWETSVLQLAASEFRLGVIRRARVGAALVDQRDSDSALDTDVVTIGIARRANTLGQLAFESTGAHGRWRHEAVLDLDASDEGDAKPGQASDVVAYRLRDLDRDESCELLVQRQNGATQIARWDDHAWQSTACELPPHVKIERDGGGDAGLRWFDLDRDGRDECLFSDPERFSVHRFLSLERGWQAMLASVRSDDGEQAGVALLPFIRPDGSNNGVWAHSGSLWWQNEDTARLPDKVDRVAFVDLLAGESVANRARTPSESDAELAVAATTEDAVGFPGPTEPADAVATFRSSIGARVELVAAEPLVVDPVAFDWSPDGRLWVAEMCDYPTTEDENLRGRVKVLIDDDDDGVYDRSEVFLDGLEYPTGVKAWRDGVLISGAPNLVFAKDTDGDLRADERVVLYRGFREGNQQHRVNGLRWGVDGWLYLANGDSGGEIESVATGEKLRINGRDLRIRPDTGEMETVSGQTQFGRCRDDLGNWFGGNNSDPIWHYVLQERYVSRNPHYAAPSVKHSLPEFPGPAPVFPASKTLPRFNDFDRANRFTSACSPLVLHSLRGGVRFGELGSVDTYVCEPVHNLIHREQRHAFGATFRSERVAADRATEFLASTDNWFRPVMIRTGPDGALWIADMYRLVIEHPEWIPMQWQRQVDIRSGNTRGRIYRVWPGAEFANDDARETTARIDQLTLAQLVLRLCHPHRWQRDMAQQLLIWQSDERVVPLLEALIREERDLIATIYALHTLDRLGGLTNEVLVDVLRRSVRQSLPNGAAVGTFSEVAREAVTRHAVMLAEQRCDATPELLDLVLAQCANPSAPLALQLACSLGSAKQPAAARALAQLALRSPIDTWVQSAVLSSISVDNVEEILRVATNSVPRDVEFITAVVGQAVSMGDDDLHQLAIDLLTDGMAADGFVVTERSVWQTHALSALADFYRRTGRIGALPDLSRQQLMAASSSARRTLANTDAEPSLRIACVKLLGAGLGNDEANQAMLLELLAPREPAELQAEAVATLLAYSQPALTAVMAKWEFISPRARTRILAESFARAPLSKRLLAYATANAISLPVDARLRQQLLRHADSDVRTLAHRLFVRPTESKSTETSLNQETLERYAAEISGLPRDPAAGQLVFERACASCHHLAGKGHRVGPDLSALSNKSDTFLLTAILDPNRAVESNYLDYQVVTEDGQLLAGLLKAETATSVSLLEPDGKEHQVLRRTIQQMRSTGLSLMPVGLEKDLTFEQMANLLGFLQTHRVERKQFAGNTPQLAPARDDGSIRLLAMHAEIFGPSLRYEPKHQNLGFWNSESDHAAWTVAVAEPGEYSVVLELACEAESAGGQFVLATENETLTGSVESTGTWDDYRSRDAGQIQLPAGRSRIQLRAAGPIESYLMDLHQVILYPK